MEKPHKRHRLEEAANRYDAKASHRPLLATFITQAYWILKGPMIIHSCALLTELKIILTPTPGKRDGRKGC